jgi:monoamine oxidase
MGRTPAFDSLIRLLQKARRRNLAAKAAPPPITKEQARWTRRHFMRTAAATGGAATVASAFPRLLSAIGRGLPRVVVVGAGIAGLNAAYQLKKAGVEATVFEARRRLGGRIFSVQGAVGDGLVTDLGGSFINSDHPDMLSLVSEFNIKLFNRLEHASRFPVPESAYYFDGRQWDEEEVAEALRPIAEQITEDADRLDADFDAVAPELDALSVKEYLDVNSDKIGEPFIRALLENTIRTEFGVEPDDSSALQLIFVLPTVEGTRVEILGYSDEKFFVQGGSGKIIEALGEALTGQVELRRELQRIEPQGSEFRLIFTPDLVIHADYVILAIPFTTLRRVQIQVDLPAGLRRFIEEVDLGKDEKIFAGFSSRPWRTEEGFVLEAWTDLGFAAVWDETQRQVDRTDGALTFFFGGDQVRRMQHGSAEFQGQRFVDRLARFLPDASDVATGRFVRTRWARDPYSRGAYTSFKPGQLTSFGEFLYIESDDPHERQDVHAGNLVFAGEHLSDAYYGFMNGAAETGRLAAQVVLNKIEEQWAFNTAPVKNAAARAANSR